MSTFIVAIVHLSVPTGLSKQIPEQQNLRLD